VRIQAPTGKESGYLLSMHLPSDWRDDGDNRVLVDGQTATVLGVQLGSRMTMSSRVLDGMTGVHYGQYGGIATRVLALAIGLILPLLYLSGMLMWWKRVTLQRKRATTNTVSEKAEINAVATR
jgi:uncharacterized iron-regulated membrane protein